MASPTRLKGQEAGFGSRTHSRNASNNRGNSLLKYKFLQRRLPINLQAHLTDQTGSPAALARRMTKGPLDSGEYVGVLHFQSLNLISPSLSRPSPSSSW